MHSHPKKKVVLYVDFIDMCRDIASILEIEDYHDVWDFFGSYDGFSNDSYQVLSLDIEEYWQQAEHDKIPPETVIAALKKLYDDQQPFDNIIARVCW